MTGFGWQPLLSFAISLIGSGLTLVYAKRAGIIDVPNLRSSHKIPTPRGGGIALVAAVAISFALSPRDGAPRYALIFLGCALLALAIVGWLDDMRGMPVARRLPVHILCGIAAALVVQNISPMEGMANILWLGWWIFWTTASVNIVNFMDGIDGMITCQGIIYGAFLFALLPSGSAGAQFGLLLAAACLGFLFWNRPPAKMFMGDVGSGPLGLFFVVGAALSLRDARTPLIFLPLFPLYLDALVTLVRRYGRGEKLTAAHREHLYQRIVGG